MKHVKNISILMMLAAIVGCKTPSNMHQIAEQAVQEKRTVKNSAMAFYQSKWFRNQALLESLGETPIFDYQEVGTDEYVMLFDEEKGTFDPLKLERVEVMAVRITASLNVFKLVGVNPVSVDKLNHFDAPYTVKLQSTVENTRRIAELTIKLPLTIPKGYRKLTEKEEVEVEKAGMTAGNVSMLGVSSCLRWGTTGNDIRLHGLVPFRYIPRKGGMEWCESEEERKVVIGELLKACRKVEPQTVMARWNATVTYSVDHANWELLMSEELGGNSPPRTKKRRSPSSEKW